VSRAFVKESDEAFAELPDRPISPHPNIVTPEGLAAIECTLSRLRQDFARVAAANDRAALAALSRDLRYWSSRKATARVATTPADNSAVQFGHAVTILRDDGRQQTYRIVGEDEADPAHGTISHASPLARALGGKAVGDTVRVGPSDLEIVAIGMPQPDKNG
jgi:transcription elongation GreA/GreB family factor